MANPTAAQYIKENIFKVSNPPLTSRPTSLLAGIFLCAMLCLQRYKMSHRKLLKSIKLSSALLQVRNHQLSISSIVCLNSKSSDMVEETERRSQQIPMLSKKEQVVRIILKLNVEKCKVQKGIIILKNECKTMKSIKWCYHIHIPKIYCRLCTLLSYPQK